MYFPEATNVSPCLLHFHRPQVCTCIHCYPVARSLFFNTPQHPPTTTSRPHKATSSSQFPATTYTPQIPQATTPRREGPIISRRPRLSRVPRPIAIPRRPQSPQPRAPPPPRALSPFNAAPSPAPSPRPPQRVILAPESEGPIFSNPFVKNEHVRCVRVPVIGALARWNETQTWWGDGRMDVWDDEGAWVGWMGMCVSNEWQERCFSPRDCNRSPPVTPHNLRTLVEEPCEAPIFANPFVEGEFLRCVWLPAVDSLAAWNEAREWWADGRTDVWDLEGNWLGLKGVYVENEGKGVSSPKRKMSEDESEGSVSMRTSVTESEDDSREWGDEWGNKGEVNDSEDEREVRSPKSGKVTSSKKGEVSPKRRKTI